jgi:hypothetical protein
LLERDGHKVSEAKTSLADWISETPWGTTRIGLAARLAFPALATWATLLLALTSTDTGVGNISIAVVGVLCLAFAYVVPWLAQRYTTSDARISKAADARVFWPTVVLTLAAILTLFMWRSLWPVLLTVAAAQTAWIAVAWIVRSGDDDHH